MQQTTDDRQAVDDGSTPREDPGDAAAIYGDGSYLAANPSWHTEDSPYKAAWIARMLEEARIEFATAAEIGCGAGAITRILAEQMPAVAWSGFDISPDVQRFWPTDLPNLHFYNEDFKDHDQFFDLVLVIDVIEHVEDVFAFLRDLRRCGRHFIFHIPIEINMMSVIRDNFNDSRDEVGHLHYFSKSTALRTLEDCEFKINKWFYTSMTLENTSRIGIKTKLVNLLKRPLYRMAPGAAARIFGRCSVMVWCQPTTFENVREGQGDIAVEGGGRRLAGEASS